MERLVVVAVLGSLAVAVAIVVDRLTGGRTVPARPGHHVPGLVHRRDFVRPEAAQLIVVFSSATCAACAGVWDAARGVASPSVAVQEVDSSAHAGLHSRYGIDGVPTTVVVDAEGTVVASFLGPVDRADLVAALDGD